MMRAYFVAFSWSDATKSYLLNLYPSIYREVHKRKSTYDYEHLLSEKIETEFYPSEQLIAQFSGGLDNLMTSYVGVITNSFYESVFSGMQKFLTMPENAIKLVEDIDIDTFMSDNILEVVRGELSNSFMDICSRFNEEYSKLIQINLEDSSNGN